ncbi:hypothetical protein HOD29_02735 [archaeon]|jgi:hypothetical protein|nr:hypothetical protein [archaeon]
MKKKSFFLIALIALFALASCNKKEKEATALAEKQKQEQLRQDSILKVRTNLTEKIVNYPKDKEAFLNVYLNGKKRPVGKQGVYLIPEGETISYKVNKVVKKFTTTKDVYLNFWNKNFYDQNGITVTYSGNKHKLKLPLEVVEIPKKLGTLWLDPVVPMWPLSLRIIYLKGYSGIVETPETYEILHRVEKDIDYFELSEDEPSRAVIMDETIVGLIEEDGTVWLKHFERW